MDKDRIISASMVVFAVSISMVVLSGVANAGVSPDDGRCIYEGNHSIIGERNLSFWYGGLMITNYTLVRDKDNKTIGGIFTDYFDSHYYKDMLTEGEYRIEENGQTRLNFFFDSPQLDVKIMDERGKEVSKVLKGENVNFEARTNLNIIEGNLPNNVSFKLVAPDGYHIWINKNNITIEENGVANITIDTTPLDEGEYKLSVKADPSTNNGLDAEGSSVSFTIEKKITITPNVKKQGVNESIVFTVATTSLFANVSLSVTRGVAEHVWFVEHEYEGGTIKTRTIGHDIFGETDEDGNFIAVAKFTKSGTYEITATYIDADNITAETTVEIEEFSATVSVEKTKYYTGDHVNITGSANAGDNITVKVDDEVIETDAEVGGFSYTWRTAGKQPDSYEIGIWVLPFSDPDSDPSDASVAIILMRGGLSATLNTKVIALGDEFKIEGVASGMDRVDILTIGPKGGSGDGFDPTDISTQTNGTLTASGLTHSLSSVMLEGDFKEKISVRKGADTGTYLIVVLSYGRDGVWGKSGSDDLINVISYNYTSLLSIKTQEQILAVLKDRTINAAGSDDLLSINTIKVENPKVRLDDIEDVLLGGNIVVSGYTNRKEDSAIIITVEGPVELKSKLAFVEKDGTFNLSFSTVSAKVGEYTVTADDGKGYFDTKTVNVITAATPLLSVGNSSGNSSTHSSAPTTGASSQSQEVVNEGGASADSTLLSRMQAEAKKQPGFEAIFAIIGLLAVVVWLRLKKRKR